MSPALKNSRTIIEVLYIEDNPGDALLMKEIFRTSLFPVHLSLARNGERALQMLREATDFSGKPRPDIILLDLTLPDLTGHEVLTAIRKEEAWKEMPVLVMSSTQSGQDLLSCYEDQANFYIVKPMDMKHFVAMMNYIESFWLARIP